MLDAVFGTSTSLAWWQECARATVIFCYGLLLVRIAGRRTFGKWSALDIIVSIIVGSNLSRALTGSAQMGGTLAATTLLLFLHWLLAKAVARWPLWASLLEGETVVLSRGGVENRSAMLRHSVSRGDLGEALRQSSVEQVADTSLVSLEPSGKITVLKGK